MGWRRAAVATGLMVGGCVAPTQAPPPPPPAPAPAPTPTATPLAEDWRDRPYAPGDWSYAGGSARYAALNLTCERGANRVRLGWSGMIPGPLTVRTSYGDSLRELTAGLAGAELALAARDPLLDQIAYSRGRFMLEAGGQQLVLPAWPELQRVVEDCRG